MIYKNKFDETMHLIVWFIEWQTRAFRTLWHIIYRPAYYRWKARRRHADPSMYTLDTDEGGMCG